MQYREANKSIMILTFKIVYISEMIGFQLIFIIN